MNGVYNIVMAHFEKLPYITIMVVAFTVHSFSSSSLKMSMGKFELEIKL